MKKLIKQANYLYQERKKEKNKQIMLNSHA